MSKSLAIWRRGGRRKSHYTINTHFGGQLSLGLFFILIFSQNCCLISFKIVSLMSFHLFSKKKHITFSFQSIMIILCFKCFAVILLTTKSERIGLVTMTSVCLFEFATLSFTDFIK